MPAQLSIYYINLASRPERREAMERQFHALGLVAQRIEAVTPTTIDADLLATAIANGGRASAALACTASHRLAYQTMLANGDTAALILEDDMDLSPALTDLVRQPWAGGVPFDLLRIERRARPVLLGRRAQFGTVPIRQCLSPTAGTGGYVISAKAAREMATHPLLTTEAIDKILFGYEGPCLFGMDVWHAVPALCQPAELASISDISPERRGRYKRKRTPGLARAWDKLGKAIASVNNMVVRRGALLHLEKVVVPFSK